MKGYQFILQVLAGLAALAAFNVVVEHFSLNSVPRQMLRKGASAEQATDVFLGNSTMQAGLDEPAFAAARLGSAPLNLGLGSSTPIEHYLLYLPLHDRHANVYYGFIDMQLTDAPELSWSALVGNRAMDYYAGLDTALDLSPGHSPLLAAQLRIVAIIPMLVERFAIWARVERLRRLLKAVGMPAEHENRFGQVKDFALLEPADQTAFAEACHAAVADRTPLNKPVSALFDTAKARGAVLYVVAMPMTSNHRRTFYGTPEWKAYEAYLETLVRAKGGVFLRSADWIDDRYFDDNLHLNPAGAEILSTRLAQWKQ
jgi:hypothetical protein